MTAPKLVSAAAALLAGAFFAMAQSEGQAKPARFSAGAVIAQFAGRFVIGSDGAGEVIGYFPLIEEIGSSLFAGEKSERRALFGLRSVPMNMSRVPNGAFNHFLLSPVSGDAIYYKVYYSPSPNRDFSNPASFSDGQPIATLKTRNGMVTATPLSSGYAAKLELVESADFVYEGRTLNFRDLGDSVSTHFSGGAVPLIDIGSGVLSIPLAGYATGNGAK